MHNFTKYWPKYVLSYMFYQGYTGIFWIDLFDVIPSKQHVMLQALYLLFLIPAWGVGRGRKHQ